LRWFFRVTNRLSCKIEKYMLLCGFKTRKHSKQDVTQMIEAIVGVDFTCSPLSSCISVAYISHSCSNVKIIQ